MLRRFIVIGACVAFSVSAQNYKDIKADSINYEQPKEWRIYSAGTPVLAFTLSKGLVWYATQDMVYSSNTKKVEVHDYAKLGQIPSSGVNSMATDRSGNVWIGGINGVAVYKENKFLSYTAENGLPDNKVNAIAVGNDGSVWVGTESGAAVFKNGEWKVLTTGDGLVSNKVQAVLVDNKGVVWFGTNKGISTFDGTKFSTHDMNNGLSWNDTKALGFDPRKGQLWAAVGENDVNCLDKGSWNTYMAIHGNISSIMVDSQSRVWFGFPTGVVKFNGDEWVTDPQKLRIPVTQVNAMIKDKGGNLWFAMESGVLCMSNPYPF